MDFINPVESSFGNRFSTSSGSNTGGLLSSLGDLGGSTFAENPVFDRLLAQKYKEINLQSVKLTHMQAKLENHQELSSFEISRLSIEIHEMGVQYASALSGPVQGIESANAHTNLQSVVISMFTLVQHYGSEAALESLIDFWDVMDDVAKDIFDEIDEKLAELFSEDGLPFEGLKKAWERAGKNTDEMAGSKRDALLDKLIDLLDGRDGLASAEPLKAHLESLKETPDTSAPKAAEQDAGTGAPQLG